MHSKNRSGQHILRKRQTSRGRIETVSWKLHSFSYGREDKYSCTWQSSVFIAIQPPFSGRKEAFGTDPWRENGGIQPWSNRGTRYVI
ncbi:hypothetical protein Y032_0072g719 [Ancylostoma ceylanicum]|uniref:Uncharacterized protein n=1 Tax=Ancylostoma ceylanicum TaxID=53326 RepID=A0A016TVW2_9BILA|nr:hypothetical protein Y032_0072g719 [Ancylostoma ceylanicum]